MSRRGKELTTARRVHTKARGPARAAGAPGGARVGQGSATAWLGIGKTRADGQACGRVGPDRKERSTKRGDVAPSSLSIARRDQAYVADQARGLGEPPPRDSSILPSWASRQGSRRRDRAVYQALRATPKGLRRRRPGRGPLLHQTRGGPRSNVAIDVKNGKKVVGRVGHRVRPAKGPPGAVWQWNAPAAG